MLDDDGGTQASFLQAFSRGSLGGNSSELLVGNDPIPKTGRLGSASAAASEGLEAHGRSSEVDGRRERNDASSRLRLRTSGKTATAEERSSKPEANAAGLSPVRTVLALARDGGERGWRRGRDRKRGGARRRLRNLVGIQVKAVARRKLRVAPHELTRERAEAIKQELDLLQRTRSLDGQRQRRIV